MMEPNRAGWDRPGDDGVLDDDDRVSHSSSCWPKKNPTKMFSPR